LALAFELHCWGHELHQPARPAAPPPPHPHPMSFLAAVGRSQPLPDHCHQQTKADAAAPAPVRNGMHPHSRSSGRRVPRDVERGGVRCDVETAHAAVCCGSSVQPGTAVCVVEKQNQRSGVVTQGVVARVLTGSAVHPRGIKVQLTSGVVGRVCALR
jgi:uncharacterized repeat protein (TIGR03833 family)